MSVGEHQVVIRVQLEKVTQAKVHTLHNAQYIVEVVYESARCPEKQRHPGLCKAATALQINNCMPAPYVVAVEGYSRFAGIAA